jgi:hypothetical protein
MPAELRAFLYLDGNRHYKMIHLKPEISGKIADTESSHWELIHTCKKQ